MTRLSALSVLYFHCWRGRDFFWPSPSPKSFSTKSSKDKAWKSEVWTTERRLGFYGHFCLFRTDAVANGYRLWKEEVKCQIKIAKYVNSDWHCGVYVCADCDGSGDCFTGISFVVGRSCQWLQTEEGKCQIKIAKYFNSDIAVCSYIWVHFVIEAV